MQRRAIVATRFGQMHARIAGSGGTPLVLLHMSPRSSQMWAYLQQELDRETIAVDRLGYGFSDAPPRPLEVIEYAQATIDALESLGIPMPFDVLGMHTGSLEAIEIAHLVPERVRRVGIVAIPIFTAEERQRGLKTFAEMKHRPVEDGSHLVQAWRDRFQYRQPPWHLADVQRRLVDYLLAPYPGESYVGVFGYDAAPRLQGLDKPVVALAPRDDLYELTLRSRSLLPPESQYVDLPDCDLDLMRKAPQRVARVIDEFMPSI
jgi:pimeloyl-ACP methyl ester carboxylesterase